MEFIDSSDPSSGQAFLQLKRLSIIGEMIRISLRAIGRSLFSRSIHVALEFRISATKSRIASASSPSLAVAQDAIVACDVRAVAIGVIAVMLSRHRFALQAANFLRL